MTSDTSAAALWFFVFVMKATLPKKNFATAGMERRGFCTALTALHVGAV
jgi:hypothetical protein